MYFDIISQCAQSLENFEASLLKAEKFVESEGVELTSLLNGRLAPDMGALIYQIQSACDYVKAGAAWLSEKTPPRHTDDEKTIEELRARISKTLTFVRSIPEHEFSNADEQQISMSWFSGRVLSGKDYLLQIVIPNVYFHIDMAYAILRNQGVNVGKMDALGKLNLRQAI